MLTFKREQTQEEKDKRDARYKAMSEESLRNAVDRFTRELKEKSMDEFEAHLKTNSLRYAMMELHRRGLFVEPVIISTQKKETETGSGLSTGVTTLDKILSGGLPKEKLGKIALTKNR